MKAELVATIIQGVKAAELNDTRLLYDALPDTEQTAALSGVRQALKAVASGSIASPSDLHSYQCDKLKKSGWRWGAVYRPLKSQTPLLVPFEALPHKLRVVIERCFLVLKQATDGTAVFAGRNAPTGNFENNNPNGVIHESK